jgi:hypothetical protein
LIGFLDRTPWLVDEFSLDLLPTFSEVPRLVFGEQIYGVSVRA